MSRNATTYYFVIPQPIKPPEGLRWPSETITFAAFAESMLDADQRCGASRKQIKLSARIEDKILSLKPGEVCALDAEEWALLRDIFDAPTSPIHPKIAKAVINWLDTVCTAGTEPLKPSAKLNGECEVNEATAP